MEYVLQTKNLTKIYGEKKAAHNVSMNIRKGDIYGFIGKNGAGKTTTMKMILNLIYASSGDIKLFGEDANDGSRRRIGSLIEAPGIYKNETAYENLRRFGLLYGTSEEEIYEILDIVNLADTGKKKAGDFSLGMRQRLGIGIAMLGKPDFLILDEPVNGLDPAAIKQIRDAIIRLNVERNVTFLISSHLLGELSKISTRYGIINNGELVEEIDAEDLNNKIVSHLEIKVSDVTKTTHILKEKFNIDCSNEKLVKIQNDTIQIYSYLDYVSAINKALVNEDIDVYELHIARADMEDYFIERIGK